MLRQSSQRVQHADAVALALTRADDAAGADAQPGLAHLCGCVRVRGQSGGLNLVKPCGRQTAGLNSGQSSCEETLGQKSG